MAMPRNAALWAAPMATSMLGTAARPEIWGGLTAAYGLYKAANIESMIDQAIAKQGLQFIKNPKN
jgi:hypothetical protein